MTKYLTFLLIMCAPVFARGQLTVTFVPELQGRTLESVMGVRIMNPDQQKRCILQVKITTGNGILIAEAATPAFELAPGMQMIPANAVYRTAWNFGQHQQAVVVKQSHQFPEGEYEYCFTVTDATNSHGPILAEQCFNHMLQPFSPLELTEPYDGDKICEKRPTLLWQPLLPALPGMTYRLLLVEIREGQARAEALHYNMPVIRQHNIPGPMLLYPPLSRELTTGKRYAWQVTAVKNETILARSEIWDFTVQCEDSLPAMPVHSFRNIEDMAKGNFYVAEGRILFAVQNSYAKSAVEYSIRSITSPEDKIRKLPKITLDHGRNEVTIDLEDVRGLTDGHFYILHLRLPNGDSKTLRFLYKSPIQ